MFDVTRIVPPAVLTTKKAVVLFGLGLTTVFAQQIPDPSIEKYVSLGVGGVLALTILYFYRQLATQSLKRERENSERYAFHSAKLLTVIEENSRSQATLIEATNKLNATVAEMNRDQRERYESDLKERGRRSYDQR